MECTRLVAGEQSVSVVARDVIFARIGVVERAPISRRDPSRSRGKVARAIAVTVAIPTDDDRPVDSAAWIRRAIDELEVGLGVEHDLRPTISVEIADRGEP